MGRAEGDDKPAPTEQEFVLQTKLILSKKYDVRLCFFLALLQLNIASCFSLYTRIKKISVQIIWMKGWTYKTYGNKAGMKNTQEDYPTMEHGEKKKH